MTYLAINTVPGARDYGYIVNFYDEMHTKLSFMNPEISHGMRKHFVFLKHDKPVSECIAAFGGFIEDISGNIVSRQATVNLEGIGISADSLTKIKDVNTEVFLPSNPVKEIELIAVQISKVF